MDEKKKLLHDLTILFLDKSGVLNGSKNLEEYWKRYHSIYEGFMALEEAAIGDAFDWDKDKPFS